MNQIQVIENMFSHLWIIYIDKNIIILGLETKSKKETKFTVADIKVLISEVQKRPPLWNYSIPLAERSSALKRRLWKEVSIALGSKNRNGKICIRK
jgi:hypothetical protein